MAGKTICPRCHGTKVCPDCEGTGTRITGYGNNTRVEPCSPQCQTCGPDGMIGSDD